MAINLEQALNIFGYKLNHLDHNTLKKMYRKYSSEYHPDRNPNGLQKMQEINMAYNFLKKMPNDAYVGYAKDYQNYDDDDEEYYEEPKKQNHDPLKKYEWIKSKGMNIRVESGKIIVSGKTFDHKEDLKREKFRWNPDEKIWWKYNS